MKFTYSFACVLVISCNIISATPPGQCSAVIDDFLAANCSPGSGEVNCYSNDPTTDFTSRDLVYISAVKKKDFTDGQYECCYTYESRAPAIKRDDCDSNPPSYSIDQSHFTLGIDCDNYESGSKCGNAIKVDKSCNGDSPCSYTLCFKWNGMTSTDKCCTSPGFYSIKNGNTDTFACVIIPTCTCTDSPTEHPTKSPSKNPTESPSKDPSQSPTKYPTESPTRSPSKDPTKFPTKSPSESPSKNPTKSPSKPPSKNPTKSPSKNPTKSPSESPSKSPSKYPTKSPSKNPTKFPSESPSKNPTKSPSKYPTKSPSKPPSKYPTKFPTKSPSKPPSKYPTKSPTEYPTKSPSKFPSKSPSKDPSKYPTKSPSKSPTESPSKDPSKFPSTFPSKFPSQFPTKSPTPTACPNISGDGPVDTCVDQANCINVISAAKNGGDQYEICIEWNVDTNCRKNGCISYACKGPHENDKTGLIGWLPNTKLCRTVNCGKIAIFGIKDSNTCSGIWTNPINDITSNCYADTDSKNGNPTDICNGASHGCTWEFTAPDCTDEEIPAHVDEEIPNDNSMKKIHEYNHKYNYKRIAYCILAVIIALILVLIGVIKFWCYYKNKQNRVSYSIVVEMEKIEDVEPMETGSV